MKTEKDIINQFPYEPRNNSKEALRKMLKQEAATKYVFYSVIGIAVLLFVYFFGEIKTHLIAEWKEVALFSRGTIIAIVVLFVATVVTLLTRK